MAPPPMLVPLQQPAQTLAGIQQLWLMLAERGDQVSATGPPIWVLVSRSCQSAAFTGFTLPGPHERWVRPPCPSWPCRESHWAEPGTDVTAV